MRYDNERLGIWLENDDDIDLANWSFHGARMKADSKEKKLRPDPPGITAPYLFSGIAAQGLMDVLKKAAEGDIEVSPELQTLASDTVVRLNEQMNNDQKDIGLLERIATTFEKLSS